VSGEARAVPEAAELLDRMTDASFGLDEDWRFTYLNDQARRLVAETTGTTYEPGELEGRHIREVLPESGDGEFFSRYREAVETGEPVTFEAEYEPLGEWFETRAFPSETGLSVYFRDVTGRRRREMRHERDREALRSLYRIAADAERSFDEKVDDVLELGCTYLDVPYGMVNELDERGQTVAYARGTPEKLAQGTTMPRNEAYCKETIRTDDLLAIVDAVEEGWRDDPAYQKHGLGCYIGGRIEVNDGVDRTLCFAGPDPRESSFTATEETIVELLTQWLTFEFNRRADRQRLERKNERLGNLASMVSHDLRNPLTIAQARIDFVSEDVQNEHVSVVSDALDRIESLIDDLTTLARQGDVIDERHPVSLSAVATDAWSAVPTAGATLDVETDPTLYADRSRLRQALENLFRNSVEHGSQARHEGADGDGGSVHVTVGGLDGDEQGFFVADDGPGIPPAEREKVLRMGYTTDESGSGIGMAIVREVVEAHGWTITVHESDRGGARFDVTGTDPLE
jgi:signal transduction histidine kinase